MALVDDSKGSVAYELGVGEGQGDVVGLDVKVLKLFNHVTDAVSEPDATTLSMMTLSLTTLSITGLFATLSTSDTQCKLRAA